MLLPEIIKNTMMICIRADNSIGYKDKVCKASQG